MNQDERNQQQYDAILDAIMKSAMISNADSCFGDIPTEEEIMQSHSFSPEFCQSMNDLLHKKQIPKQKLTHLARIEADQNIEAPDQSFWEEWKQQHPATGSSLADSHSRSRNYSRRLRPLVKTAIAAAAAFAVVVGGVHLSDNGFLRASRTQNVVEYDGQSMLLTDMVDGDYNITFKKPGFIPKKYKVISDYQSNHMRMLVYSDGTQTLTIKYDILSDSDTFLDSERHPEKEKSIRLNQKYDALLSLSGSSGTYSSLTWQDGLIQYRILGYESELILLQIAESIMP